MWPALLSALGAARAASAAKDVIKDVMTSVIVGSILFLAVIFISIAAFYGLEPSRGPAGAAFIVALVLGGIGLIVHYTMSSKPANDSGDLLSNPTAAINKLTSSDNVEYVQREATRIVRQNPLKVSALAIVAGIILARRL
jgi:anaerobic C4-dicarboxylate transporter